MNELKTIPSHMITEEMRANGINEGSEFATREDMVNTIGIELVEQIEHEAISTEGETANETIEETTDEVESDIEETINEEEAVDSAPEV